MSSISDENLANDSHSSVSKFKIANVCSIFKELVLNSSLFKIDRIHFVDPDLFHLNNANLFFEKLKVLKINYFFFLKLNGFTNNNQLVRIAESVYCGNINSIRNERALCKLGIEFVVDMSNMRPDDLSRAQTLGKLPCLCKRQQHSRLYLTIEIRETSFKVVTIILKLKLKMFCVNLTIKL